MNNKGMTLTEITMGAAILGTIALVMSTIISLTFKTSTDFNLQAEAHSDTIQALQTIETRIILANEIITAEEDEIIFIADINTYPDYDDTADYDSDGTANRIDPDVDGDSVSYAVSPAAAWKTGYDLYDDDCDNDNKIDMKWKICLDGRSLIYDYSCNEEPWGNHEKTIIENVTNTGIFTYLGSTDQFLSLDGENIDSDSNGAVTAEEMDAAGNDNGELDQQQERDYIVSVKIALKIDKNNDGAADFEITTEVLPPLLYIKRLP